MSLKDLHGVSTGKGRHAGGQIRAPYISRMRKAQGLDQGRKINILHSHKSHLHGVTQLFKGKLCTCIFPYCDLLSVDATTAQTALFYELLGKAKLIVSFATRSSQAQPSELYLWCWGLELGVHLQVPQPLTLDFGMR